MVHDGDPFLTSSARLVPQDAVAAIILVDGDRYLLQQRDFKPEIFYPGFWGCFGGAHEPGETDEQALAREIDEELGLTPADYDARYFVRFTSDFAFRYRETVVRRNYYEFSIPQSAVSRIRLGEGRAFGLLTRAEVLTGRITPYDAFALWLHINRERVG